MNWPILCLILLFLVLPGFYQYTVEKPGEKNAGESAAPNSSLVKVYYFHTTHRCASCMKIEKLTTTSVKTNFKKELTDGALTFDLINLDKKEYEHFVKKYSLYTKSVVLSKVVNGKEVEWKNLEKVWLLLRSPEKFKEYIKTETRAFLEALKGKKS
jgi:hypothetical protein